ncbi:MAG: hypothetical protein ICV72_02920 [Aldersonia sp.]|nr:hypothetical protein [Aldersonia sp.]
MHCAGCAGGIDHCHGTLVVHIGRVECTDPECRDLHRDRHVFVVDCYDLAGGCSCREVLGRRAG